MKLVASLIVAPTEVDRYLLPCVESLAGFCDDIRIWADGSPETVRQALTGLPVSVEGVPEPEFFRHEGRARNKALSWALAGNPTHILSIDADELVADGREVRKACRSRGDALMALCMQEVWNADEQGLQIRMDGGWYPHEVGILYRVPASRAGDWRIPDRQLACGRVPEAVNRLRQRRGMECITEILHFGWTSKAERAARYQRYVQHDGGRFHNRRHLDSIMHPDVRVNLCSQDWPPGLTGQRTQVLARVNRRDSAVGGETVG